MIESLSVVDAPLRTRGVAVGAWFRPEVRHSHLADLFLAEANPQAAR